MMRHDIGQHVPLAAQIDEFNQTPQRLIDGHKSLPLQALQRGLANLAALAVKYQKTIDSLRRLHMRDCGRNEGSTAQLQPVATTADFDLHLPLHRQHDLDVGMPVQSTVSAVAAQAQGKCGSNRHGLILRPWRPQPRAGIASPLITAGRATKVANTRATLGKSWKPINSPAP